MITPSPTLSANSNILSQTRLGCFGLIVALIVALGSPIATLHANPYGSYEGRSARGYYHSPGSGWSGSCNRGGWLGTGVPNGLGWALFGLTAGATICRPTYVAPAPVVVEQPVYVQPPVVVSRPSIVQAPLVNYNGVPCYYIEGNYYPATAMQ